MLGGGGSGVGRGLGGFRSCGGNFQNLPDTDHRIRGDAVFLLDRLDGGLVKRGDPAERIARLNGMGSALPARDDALSGARALVGGRLRGCASDFFLGSILSGGGLSGFDRVEGEDAADRDNVERENNQERMRKLHVRLLLGTS